GAGASGGAGDDVGDDPPASPDPLLRRAPDPPLALDDLLEPAAAGLYRDVIEPALRVHGVWRGDLVLTRADGSAVPVSAQFVAHTSDGILSSVSLVARDVSEQVAIQEQ